MQKERPGICKRFWQYSKSQKRDSTWISSLLHNRQVDYVSDTQTKVEVLKQQCQSVFTLEVTSNISQKARAILTYKIRHELVAVLKAPYLSIHPRRSRKIHENSVQIQYDRTDYLKHSFFYRAPVIWNCLPVEVAEAPSLDSFKACLAEGTISTSTCYTNRTPSYEHDQSYYWLFSTHHFILTRSCASEGLSYLTDQSIRKIDRCWSITHLL